MHMPQDTMLYRRLALPLGGTGFVYERSSLTVMCEGIYPSGRWPYRKALVRDLCC
jgi:hypothetical protein